MKSVLVTTLHGGVFFGQLADDAGVVGNDDGYTSEE